MIKKTITQQSLIDLHLCFSEKTDIKNTAYNYFRIQNKLAIKPIVQPTLELIDTINEYTKEYSNEYKDLLVKYAKKDASGDAIVLEQTDRFVRYDITPENQKIIIAEGEKLKKTKYKKEFAEFEKGQQQLDKILKEEKQISLHQIKRKNLPDNLPDDVMELIFDLIES